MISMRKNGILWEIGTTNNNTTLSWIYIKIKLSDNYK